MSSIEPVLTTTTSLIPTTSPIASFPEQHDSNVTGIVAITVSLVVGLGLAYVPSFSYTILALLLLFSSLGTRNGSNLDR
jgi:hypothetical protein